MAGQPELGRVPSHRDEIETKADGPKSDPFAVEVDEVPAVQLIYEHDPFEVDQAYLNASKSTRFYRGVLFQMILFGALSFVGPAMTDGINNLGGGGLSTVSEGHPFPSTAEGLISSRTLPISPAVSTMPLPAS